MHDRAYVKGWIGLICAAAVFSAMRIEVFSQSAVAASQAVLKRIGEVWAEENGTRPERRIEAEFVVNYYDPEWKVLWAQDGERAVYLNLGETRLRFESGDRVRLKGSTVAGKPDIDWSKAEIEILEKKAWSKPLDLSSLAPAANIPKEAAWAELEGYLYRFQTNDAQHVEYTLTTTRHGVFRLFLRKGTTPVESKWEEGCVRVQGVLSYTRDPAGNLRHQSLWVPEANKITYQHEVSEDDFFLAPNVTVAELNQRVGMDARVNGTVRHFAPGKTITVSDGTGQITTEVWQSGPLQNGDTVEFVLA